MQETRTVWNYRNTIKPSDADLVGYDVEALDGKIGAIDAASRESGQSHLVVDTGFWIFGKKRLIPAGVVTSIDHDERCVHVNMTKDQIKDAPDWEATWDEDSRTRYDAYYSPFGW